MQNYKIEVQNHSESIEAQELFFNLGYSWFHKKFEAIEIKTPETIMCFENGALTTGIRGSAKHKQITLQELRDMVAQKQKEYLVKTDTSYTLQVLSDVVDGHDGIIEVPEGAEILTACGLALYFWNKTNNTTWVDGEGWVYCDDERLCTLKSYLSDKDVKIVWQRESLNDQVASAEQARQEQTQTREISECDLIDSGKLIIGGLGESFPVGLEHHKFIQPEGLPFVGDEQTGVDGTLAERQAQYGNFSEVAEMTQQLLTVMGQYGYEYLPDMHKEALHMICSKMARIVNGDHNHLDSWHDIGGYAKLIENNIK